MVHTLTLQQSIQIHPPLQLFSGQFVELALLFFVLALVAALAGARGLAGLSMTIAKWFVIAFVVLALVSLVL